MTLTCMICQNMTTGYSQVQTSLISFEASWTILVGSIYITMENISAKIKLTNA
jgi:virulence-associated protein VapD